MKIGPLGIVEILIILAVILIIFGPKNLPKLGTAIGKAVKNLREGIGGNKKVKEAKDTDDGEVVEVIDKPKPGTAKADDAADAKADTADDAADAMPVEKPKPKAQVAQDDAE